MIYIVTSWYFNKEYIATFYQHINTSVKFFLAIKDACGGIFFPLKLSNPAGGVGLRGVWFDSHYLWAAEFAGMESRVWWCHISRSNRHLPWEIITFWNSVKNQFGEKWAKSDLQGWSWAGLWLCSWCALKQFRSSHWMLTWLGITLYISDGDRKI